MQAPVALPRCFAEILCPDFGFGSLREFRPRCRSFTVIHQVLPQNCASSVRKIYSQITLVQLCGIALNPQVPCVITCERVARHCYPQGPSLALRAIHLVPRLRRPNRLCSSKLSGTANRQRNGSTLCSPTVGKILCRSPVSKRSPVSDLRQANK